MFILNQATPVLHHEVSELFAQYFVSKSDEGVALDFKADVLQTLVDLGFLRDGIQLEENPLLLIDGDMIKIISQNLTGYDFLRNLQEVPLTFNDAGLFRREIGQGLPVDLIRCLDKKYVVPLHVFLLLLIKLNPACLPIGSLFAFTRNYVPVYMDGEVVIFSVNANIQGKTFKWLVEPFGGSVIHPNEYVVLCEDC